MGALVCDVPGMGKTWLMESLAIKYGATNENEIVMFLGLSKLSKVLSSQHNYLPFENALLFAIQQATKSKLVQFILLSPVVSNKITFFLDGFDEIIPDLVENTTKYLKDLRKSSRVRLVISSRPHMREHLEKTFKLISYDILPLTREEQINSLFHRWQSKFQVEDSKPLKHFAGQCVDSVKQLQRKDTRNILGVPLRCFILAVVNEGHARQIVISHTNQKRFKIEDSALFDSIFELYERFIETSFKNIEIAGVRPEEFHAVQQKLLNYHTFKALELLFPLVADAFCTTYNISMMDIDISLTRRVGILCHPNNEFVHRTFAEFFAGKFFATFWINNPVCETRLFTVTGHFFVDKLLKLTWNKDILKESMKSISLKYELPNVKDSLTEKLCEFEYEIVLWFTNNSIIEITDTIRTNLQLFKQVLLISNECEKFRGNLKTNLYFILIALAKENFLSITYLFGAIVRAFVDESEITGLMLFDPNDSILSHCEPTPDRQASVPFLLFNASCTCHLETVQAIFSVFCSSTEQYLTKFCLTR